jgi:hypothetical protein
VLQNRVAAGESNRAVAKKKIFCRPTGRVFFYAEVVEMDLRKERKRLNDHAEKLRTLETSEARNGVIITGLCKKWTA